MVRRCIYPWRLRLNLTRIRAFTVTPKPAISHARREALSVAVEYLFSRAVLESNHFGALYSRAIALKLYPLMLGYNPGEAAEEAYQDMCASQQALINASLQQNASSSRAPRDVVNAMRACSSVRITDDLTSHPCVRMEPMGRQFPGAFVAWLKCPKRALAIQGMDATIHDFPLHTPQDTSQHQCHVFHSTAGCYPALWRQFQQGFGATEPPHFSRIATVTHFSSSQYYHWVMDGLPKLVALGQALANQEDQVPLLLPAAQGAFIRESLELIEARSKEAGLPNPLESFDVMLHFDPSQRVTADEILVAHWKVPDTHPGSQVTCMQIRCEMLSVSYSVCVCACALALGAGIPVTRSS